MNPKYPIYVISKGRAKTATTHKIFDKMNVNYNLVVEECEYDEYCLFTQKKNILVLPFSNLGQGSIPARNWVFEHSIKNGYKRHWIFDDNITCFYRLNMNRKIPVNDGTIFYAIEDFVERYENIALAGLNYDNFAPQTKRMPPYRLNWRVYSMILIDNSIPHRWRGKFNEDTDLSLRVLKDGYCTIVFNAFLGDKTTTMKKKGGNTDNVYNTGKNRKDFAESLAEQHPDLVSVVWRYNRWHHKVRYSAFKNNKLKKKDGVFVPDVVNNFGMKLIKVNNA